MVTRTSSNFMVIASIAAMLIVACGGGATPAASSAPAASTAAAATATPVPTSACTTPGRCEPPDDILAKAKTEGSVVMYSSLGTALMTPLGKMFEDKYGVKVVATETPQANSMTRIQQEAAANKRVADIIPLGVPSVLQDWVKSGITTTFTSAQVPNAAVLKQDQILASSVFFYGGAVYTLGYNTAKSPGGVPPKGYCELTDPKWKGLVGLTFQPGATTFKHYDMIEKACGAGYFSKLLANDVKLFSGTPNATQSLAAGEFAALISTVPYILAPFKEKGAPVDFTLPSEGITVSTRWGALVKDAPHPNAALVFMNFLLSVDAQKLMYTGNFLGYSVLPKSVVPDSLQTTVPVTYADVTNAGEAEPRISKELGKG